MRAGADVHIDSLSPGVHRQVSALPVGGGPGSPGLAAHALVGRSPRPCLGLVAGVHGDEYDGIRALHRLTRQTDIHELIGSLLIIPVANVWAFAAGQRCTPADGCDLNRVFPGRRDGSPTEQLAAMVCYDVLSQCDAVFSLHGAAATGVLSPWVEFLDVPGEVGKSSYELAMASGFGDLMALDERPGRLLRALGELGVPLIEGEVGGCGRSSEENIAYYLARVASVARYLGVAARDREPSETAPERSVWRLGPAIEATAGGLFVCEVGLRQAVQAGDRLGSIVDAFGDEIASVTTPVDGVVGGHREHCGVQRGDALVTLWSVPRSPTVQASPR